MRDRLRTLGGMLRSLAIYRARPLAAGRLAAFYRQILAPGDLAFDIGAHVGNRSLAMIRAGARVVALEPQAAFAALLRRSLPPEAVVLEAAVGAEPGRAALAVSRLHPTVSSIAPGFAARMAAAPGFGHVRWDDRRSVEVTTLDALIARFGSPRFVKIDVEGHEAAVLAGLSRPVAWLAFEHLPSAPEVTRTALARIAGLGPYAFNFVPGETQAFSLDVWTDAAGLLRWLAARPADARSGDIYARAGAADA